MIETGNTRATSRHFLSMRDIETDALKHLLSLARQLKEQRQRGPRSATSAALDGRHVALVFEKPSLRTRTTFEIAVRELGGNPVHIPSDIFDGARETLGDIARNLERWVHGLVVRTFAQQKAAALAAAAPNLHVINALTDEEHPCQALADMLTLHEHWGDWRGRTVAYVGDGNNVAASLAHATAMLGVSFRIATPEGYELPAAQVDAARQLARDGATISCLHDARQAVEKADAVYTDVWTSMGQEEEAAARRKVFAPYQVSESLMALAAPGALFMHCLPAHRGEEVTDGVLESARSVVFDQAENRLHTQKALLVMLLA